MKVGQELSRFNVLPDKRQHELEYRLRGLCRLARVLRKELVNPYRLPLMTRMRAWRRGFSSKSWLLYELDKHDPGSYLADVPVALGAAKVNGYFGPIVGNKLMLSQLLEVNQVAHPRVLYTLSNGQLLGDNTESGTSLRESIGLLLKQHPRQVLRPMWSGGGQGVFFLKAQGSNVHINDRSASLSEVVSIFSGLSNYLATEYQVQAPYAHKIFPGATNTIRLLTLWDETTASAFVAAAAHRFGTTRSAPLDNFHQGFGGVCAPIDLTTGVMGQAATVDNQARLQRMAQHPETGEMVQGTTVEGFQAIVDGVVAIANRLAYCPCIGWDVVQTSEGYRIIEANPTPGYWVWQVHQPLLNIPRVRTIYARWGLTSAVDRPDFGETH